MPRVFLEAATRLNDINVWTLALMAAAYSSLRLIEAYGLWRNQAWAEWLAVVSGAIYVPFEIHGLIHKFDLLKLSLLAINLFIVVAIAYVVWKRKQDERRN
jgi:uncharacterized membrane protein (DUF2068 family)